MNKLLIIAIFGAFTACSQTTADKPNGSDFGLGKKLKRLKNDQIKEASGIAASIRNPGMLWTHNDSGNDAELFLLDTALNVKLNVKFTNLTNRDWEDIAVGPGPDPAKSYVYVGEIGDNFGQYQEKKIYCFEEPAIGGNIVLTIDSVEVIKIQLPKARKDTEALMIDATTRDLYIVSKREKPVVVYRIKYPYPMDSTIIADSITTIPYSQICGGDISGDGKEILLKNYQNVLYWKLRPDEKIEDAFKRKPIILPYEEEPQGEAITFARDGSGYFTLSEIVKDEKTYLTYYQRLH